MKPQNKILRYAAIVGYSLSLMFVATTAAALGLAEPPTGVIPEPGTLSLIAIAAAAGAIGLRVWRKK